MPVMLKILMLLLSASASKMATNPSDLMRQLSSVTDVSLQLCWRPDASERTSGPDRSIFRNSIAGPEKTEEKFRIGSGARMPASEHEFDSER